jgi:hypothetical protein
MISDSTSTLLVLSSAIRVSHLSLFHEYSSYQNYTSVQEQISLVQNYSNVLLWYTGDSIIAGFHFAIYSNNIRSPIADEPDGTSDPLNATSIAYEEIVALDGYRHPISLCLNCQNYFWSNYSAGADIVMQDTYMIGNNVTWSLEWDTACTVDFGCCGCDNCA